MSPFHRVLLGAISGTVATGPMTVAMVLAHRQLPARERYPLPPRQVTMQLARKAGLAKSMDSEERSEATLLSHFAYGAACGGLYGVATDPSRSPVAKGVVFGLLIWAVSYLGLLPAAGLLTPATEHPARRNLLMIGAHLVWGIVLSGMAAVLSTEAGRRGTKPFSRETPRPAERAQIASRGGFASAAATR